MFRSWIHGLIKRLTRSSLMTIESLHQQSRQQSVTIYSNGQLKFIERSFPNDVYVWGNSGWNRVKHCHKTVKFKVWRILFEDHSVLYAADDHLLMDGLTPLPLKTLLPNQCVNGKRVLSIDETNHYATMYDLELAGDDKTYFTNGILSHNSTTIAAGFMLHRIVFGDHEKWAILANKGVIAREILSRLKMAFEYLPLWIKPGVLEWNKGKITLDNGCSVVAESTGGDALRGLSCLGGQETVTIRDTQTGEIKELSFEELERQLSKLQPYVNG